METAAVCPARSFAADPRVAGYIACAKQIGYMQTAGHHLPRRIWIQQRLGSRGDDYRQMMMLRATCLFDWLTITEVGEVAETSAAFTAVWVAV